MNGATGIGAGIQAIAVAFPRQSRTNDWWRERHASVVQDAERQLLGRVWRNLDGGTASAAFDAAMVPYLADPFRGSVSRRVLGPGESTAGLELDAARRALEAAGLEPGSVDLIVSVSFLGDAVGIGNGVFLAGELGVSCPAWNLETACSGALFALQAACALVAAGQYRRVLVTVSCAYSRVTDESSTLSWSAGDGAAAFVVGATPPGQGLLAAHGINTAETRHALRYQLETRAEGPAIRMAVDPVAGRLLRDTAEEYLVRCCRGALDRANLAMHDVDFVVVNTPTAWYVDFCADVLGVPRHRTVDTHPLYANLGPALLPVNLHHAVASGRILPGHVVLLYSVGSVSSAGAAVVRWGTCAAGPLPD